MAKFIKKLIRKRRANSVKGEFGFLDSFDGQTMRGWAKSDDKQARLLITKNGHTLSSFRATAYREDLLESGYGDCAFDEPFANLLADAYKDKQEMVLGVQFRTTLRHLNGSPVRINTRNIVSRSTRIHNYIRGWIKDSNNPGLKFKVSFLSNDQVCQEVLANQSSFDEGDGYSFEFDLERFSLPPGSQVELKAKVIGNVFPISIREVEESHLVSEKTSASPKLVTPHGFSSVGSEDLVERFFRDEIRTINRDSQRSLVYPELEFPVKHGKLKPLVVIPVYDGIEETIACINSVFGVSNREQFDVLVIDDCGPDDEIRKRVSDLQSKFGFRYIKNHENQGFVKSANLGLSLAGGADVVLLNSDTVVTDYWLDNLKQACYQESNIGTVTPMSNNASIFSFPEPLAYNDFPSKKEQITLVGKLFNENPSTIFKVPTAHGFCMYIRYDAMKEVGLFDEKQWGLGYGEENDLSMRMISQGWKNVMVTNTFVYHHGSVSFSERAKELMESSLRKLVGLYPKYLALVEMHSTLDPARASRNTISRKLIQGSLKPHSVLIVRHDFFGGTDKAIEELIGSLVGAGYGCFTLKVQGNEYWIIKDEESGAQLKLSWRSEMNEIIKFLRLLNLDIIDYHNVLQFSPVVKDLPSLLSVKYILSVHDYYLLCPRVTLTNNVGGYCYEPDAASCNNCIKNNGVYESLYMAPISFSSNISEWRKSNAKWVSGAEKVVVPDLDVKSRLSNYFSPREFEVRPHDKVFIEESFTRGGGGNKVPSKKTGMVIGVVGAIGYHKGLSNLYKFVKYIESKRLDARVKVIGYTEHDNLFLGMKKIEITGRYKTDELEALLEDVDVVLFPGEVPETYSYVLSEVLSLQKKIVAVDVGAISSRLRTIKVGKVISLPFNEEKVFNEIKEYVSDFDDNPVGMIVVESNSRSHSSIKELYCI